MAIPANSDARIPIICVDDSAVVGGHIFNPNSWSDSSKGIVQSCWTEYSVLHHCVGQIANMCNEAEQVCQRNIKTIQQQWATSKFDLERIVIYGQQPDLHMRIEAFFSGVKSLLDLLVQLLPSENIVTGAIDGFHRTQNVYGGTVINAIRNNVPDNRKALAKNVDALISEHKASWIDQAISARDQLIHPKRGMHQLMFHLDFVEQEGRLDCVKVNPPEIDSIPIDQYSQRILGQAKDFASDFLALLRDPAVTNKGIEPTR